MSRSLVYRGVRAVPHFRYTAIEWGSEKASRYLSPLGTSHRTLNKEVPAPMTG